MSALPQTPSFIATERSFAARNYDPLPVVLSHGEGAWITDVDGRRYLDLMSAYSAVSFGHAHPAIVGALQAQARELAVTSRAFFNDRLPVLLEKVAKLTGLPRAIPSSGGAEAVETALKAARKWAYQVKGVARDRAQIVVCRDNFHGRSITIVGFSSEAQYRDGFGPFAPGFVTIPYGDAAALDVAITPDTAAFLVEPVQGEAGIGGLLPVSMFTASDDVMQVFAPGDHGSTFGGNPLAAAVAIAALDVLEREDLCARSAQVGAWLLSELRSIRSPLVKEVRGRGMFIGIEVDTSRVRARTVVDRLLARGLLTKDTHGTVVRIAPPLVTSREDLEWAVGEIAATLRELDGSARPAA
jgi:ornithine--oxo-acid transaminase